MFQIGVKFSLKNAIFQDFFNQHPRVSAQTEQRVKKLTKFFGDEPPLLRLYLKNLGYEKYASIFEEAKIGKSFDINSVCLSLDEQI